MGKGLLEAHDQLPVYCRRLGHEVTFNYCRREKIVDRDKELPCVKILDCWSEKLPAREFLLLHYKTEDIAYIDAPPPPKIASLIELIEKAKKGA